MSKLEELYEDCERLDQFVEITPEIVLNLFMRLVKILIYKMEGRS